MSIIDTFQGMTVTPDDPFTNAATVVPSDTADLFFVSRGLLIYGPPDQAVPVKVTMKDGGTVRLYLTCGTIHRLRVSRVWATDTNLIADQAILALW